MTLEEIEQTIDNSVLREIKKMFESHYTVSYSSKGMGGIKYDIDVTDLDFTMTEPPRFYVGYDIASGVDYSSWWLMDGEKN